MRWLRPLNLLVNGAMVLATPIGGGGFLVDVLAGIYRRCLDLRGALDRRQFGCARESAGRQTEL